MGSKAAKPYISKKSNNLKPKGTALQQFIASRQGSSKKKK